MRPVDRIQGGWGLMKKDGPFGSRRRDHTLTCCLNGGGRKTGRRTRVRHEAAVRLNKGRRKLTSPKNVSASLVGDLPR